MTALMKRSELALLIYNVMYPLRGIIPDNSDISPHGKIFHELCYKEYNKSVGKEVLAIMEKIVNE